jgi:hypothetical protein
MKILHRCLLKSALLLALTAGVGLGVPMIVWAQNEWNLDNTKPFDPNATDITVLISGQQADLSRGQYDLPCDEILPLEAFNLRPGSQVQLTLYKKVLGKWSKLKQHNLKVPADGYLSSVPITPNMKSSYRCEVIYTAATGKSYTRELEISFVKSGADFGVDAADEDDD